ncbi:MAG: hypothetical protein LPK46_12485 [Bacteroidota bacterium]|nr:hypothetical protein [Bacteroidota bacterium]MDX5447519.1 hypothetical protein [Bacteroidota bacterium]MDX5506945.1 hypothetical protein [Bacteroidota bacterium]
MSRIFRLFHPEVFQGVQRSKRYFEGWYFKQVSANEQFAFALIPGISIDENGVREAFIQFIDGQSATTHYIPFSGDSFLPEKEGLEVRIGMNLFSRDRVKIDLRPGLDLQGDFTISGHHSLRPTLFRPGIMGWYSYIPFMECYHGMVSMRHELSGWIRWNGTHHTLDGGSGYIEKDWGRSFPRSWIWMQSHNFDRPDVSLMFSLADIPWIGYHFPGFLCSFLLGKEIHIMATYTGAKLEVQNWDGHSLSIVISDNNHKLTLSTQQALSGILKAPTGGKMIREIAESIDAEIEVQFETLDGELLYRGKGRKAGVEMVGEVDGLLSGKI